MSAVPHSRWQGQAGQSQGHIAQVEEFRGFDKIARFYRDVVITEKIDGTNAQVCIEPLTDEDTRVPGPWIAQVVSADGEWFVVRAGSRTRYVTPECDNHGFAAWVAEHCDELMELGPGRHFGEWWGHRINRGYGCEKDERYFSLFNTSRWFDERPAPCDVVPVLYEGPLTDSAVEMAMELLWSHGSFAKPEYDRPEGVVIYHKHANKLFKVTLEGDQHKALAA